MFSKTDLEYLHKLSYDIIQLNANSGSPERVFR